MTGGDDPGLDDGPDERTLQSGRAWQHPSEVGLATRGRADRRRSTFVASGVVLGGVGLLITGVVLGGLKEPADTTASTLPVERADLSVATVSVADGAKGTVTGVVVDDAGHVIVDATALGDADQVWAKCGDGELQPAEVVGSDPDTGLVLLQLEDPSGVPVSVARTPPNPGSELRLVRARGGVAAAVPAVAVAAPAQHTGQLMNLVAASTPRHFEASLPDAAASTGDAAAREIGLTGSMAFDRAGRLLGIVTDDTATTGGADAVHVLTASEVMDAADRLIAAHD